MKQVLQSYRTGELWLAEVPMAACGRGGALVRTRCSLVSAGTEKMLLTLAKKSLLGKAKARPDLVKQVLKKMKTEGFKSTMEQVFAKLDEPICLGYSAAGDVIEAGREATSLKPGDRVAVAGAGYATHAEFNFVPANLCAKIPEGVSYADASFATIGSIALQGVRQTEPQLGERIVVIGLGLLGLLTVQMLKANGCAVMGVDLDDEKVALALKFGADVAVSSGAEKACEAFTGGRGADAVIITAATPSNGPIESAAEMSRHKGRVVAVGLVGMNVPRDSFYRKELDLRLSMSYGPGRYDASYEEGGNDYPFAYVRFTEQRNMESFLYLVQQGKVTPAALVTHRIAFDDALDAYALLEGKLPEESKLDRKYLGILLEYPENAPLERTIRRTDSAATGTGSSQVGVGFLGAGGFAKAILLPHLTKIEAEFDGVLAIYADGSETPIACNDDHGTTRASRAQAQLIAGQRYEVVIDGYHGSSGSYGVVVNREGGPGVTTPGQVLNLALNQPARGDTRQGSDAHQPGCGSRPGALDQTWRVVPSVSGAFQFHVDAEYDSVLAIYEAGSATPMLCNDDFGSTRRSRLNTRLEAGRTYHVVVDGYARGSGTYTLTMSVANSGAAPSSGGGTIQLSQPVTGNTSAATDQRAPTCGSRPGTPDETWSFTVPQTAMYRIHVQAQYDSLLAVFTSTGTQLACNDDFQTTRASRIETSLTAGDTVYIVVDGFQGAQGTYQLVVQPMSAGGPSIPVAPTPTAPQVENITLMETRCANAPPLTAGRLTGRIVAADAAAVVTCGGGGVGGESIHRVEVTEATTLTVTATSPLRPALELRSGCSRGSTVVACVGPTNDRASTATVLTARLTPGQTYFLVVDSQTASDGVFTLETTLESGVETAATPTP